MKYIITILLTLTLFSCCTFCDKVSCNAIDPVCIEPSIPVYLEFTKDDSEYDKLYKLSINLYKVERYIKELKIHDECLNKFIINHNNLISGKK